MNAVRELHGDKTILIVAHRLSTVEHCDRLFLLENGRLVKEGNASMMLRDIGLPKNFSQADSIGTCS